MSLANESEMANVEFRELARILATGILRFRTHAALANKEKSSESDEKALEVSDATVLSVHTGKRFLRLSERSEDVD